MIYLGQIRLELKQIKNIRTNEKKKIFQGSIKFVLYNFVLVPFFSQSNQFIPINLNSVQLN
jgi:ABC-type lipoprotein export system ATPase subunit